MNKKIFTIPELIYKGMLSSELASFLYFCIFYRLNVTVAGITGSGKTTLINALDLLVPKFYRKIYVEETAESLDLLNIGHHQLKYIVSNSADSDDISIKSSSKVREIYKLLHRNPDVVYLGEILTANEAHAMFHCLSAGLRGFQTIHALSLDSLINRWIYHFNINPSCFNDLDILIQLKYHNFMRRIDTIAEISFENQKIHLKPIYQYNYISRTWEKCFNFKESTLINKRIKNPSEIEFWERISENYIKKIFDILVEKKNWSIETQTKLFNSISFRILNILKKEIYQGNFNETFKFDNILDGALNI